MLLKNFYHSFILTFKTYCGFLNNFTLHTEIKLFYKKKNKKKTVKISSLCEQPAVTYCSFQLVCDTSPDESLPSILIWQSSQAPPDFMVFWYEPSS